jgi:hypothetical protein
MLIVGLAAAAMAITVYYVWFLAKRGRELWRDRNAESFSPAAKRPRLPGCGNTVSWTDRAQP